MLSFIIKGILRDRHRSLLPIIVVGSGVMLMVVFYGYIQGVVDNLLSTSSKLEHGHLKVMTKEYADIIHQTPNDLAIPQAAAVFKELNKLEGVTWTPRIKFGGLIGALNASAAKNSQGSMMGIGMDLLSPHSTEIERMNLKKTVVQGRRPLKQGEIIVSEELEKSLGVKLGDTVVFMGSTVHGNTAVRNFKVVGFIRFGIPALDRNMVLADIQDVQNTLKMQDSAAEILGFLNRDFYVKETAAQLKKQFRSLSFNNDKLVVHSIEESESLEEYLNMIQSSMVIAAGALLILMTIVIWNSSLMSSLRRYGEIGVRLALGESKGELLRSLLYESAAVGFIGALLGAGLGTAFCFYLKAVGFDISDFMEGSTMLISPILRADATAAGFLIGLIPGVFACLIGALMAGMGIYRRSTSSLFKELEA